MNDILSRHQLPFKPEYIEPALSFIRGYKSANLDDNLINEVREVLKMVIDNNRKAANTSEQVLIEIKKNPTTLGIEIFNRGKPIYFPEIQERLINTKDIKWSNLGRQGQVVTFLVPLGPQESEPKELALDDRWSHIQDLKNIEIRRLKSGEEPELSRLFYQVYEYNYINELVYFPEKLKALIENGDLESWVAADSHGQVIGHVGLVRKNTSPAVYEAAMGVVDPTFPIRGIFKSLFAQIMNRVQEISMQYCFFDFVTNHDLSQRSVNHYGNIDMALLVGCQRKDTQARLEHLGLGKDSATMDRYSLLCGLVPRVERPFGSSISVPGGSGEIFEFILKPLGLDWTPRTRFDQIARVGKYVTTRNPAQNSVEFDLQMPGREAVQKICEEWRHLLREGYLYASVVAATDQPGLRHVYDDLAAHGFFIGGFLPYHFSNRLGLVMQSVGPARVDWNNIRVHSDRAKQLLELVRRNYERNVNT